MKTFLRYFKNPTASRRFARTVRLPSYSGAHPLRPCSDLVSAMRNHSQYVARSNDASAHLREKGTEHEE
ncbi:hypothetical protein U370_04645 [Anaplasma marginale str. Dawn]|uniref:Uncharacterized protein n=2 Tax=Anaplasma marginale TaxID=770 RepID=B9KH56_ANAMF|nr:hypothetical protein [Anaplasma marginale]AGZ79223.1 hypothetical protein U128_04850 [Anaplasma marginale str. Gypsy Plains]AGZ80014.1 hypothetical protein U370_04645 [Anaplasma marginale str. Dawn]AAV87054.1 hypothetical protein AM1240 [Anaplasma marginale str. St. Maries]ACM49760.1 Hypothetical protein AMF_938 [Anaplasma marginale str. Florida]AHW57128.1 hypothetical protein [Anaplasma marginale]